MNSNRLSKTYFLLGQWITGTGDQLFNVILALLIFHQSGSPFFVGSGFAILFAGSVCGYFVVPHLKKHPPLSVIRITDGLSASLVFLLPFAQTLLIPLLFVLGFLRSINRPFNQSLIPKMAWEDKQLNKLNRNFQMINSLSLISGFVLGAYCLHIKQISLVFFLDGLSFLFCIVLSFGIRLTQNLKQGSTESARHFPVQVLLKENKTIQNLLLPASAAFGLIIAFNNQIVILIHTHTMQDFTYILCEYLMALGIFIGAFLAKQEKVISWPLAWMITALCYVAAAFSHSLVFILLILSISALFDGISSVKQMNLLHRIVPPEKMEQIFSLRFTCRNIAKTVFSFLLGWFIDKTSLTMGLALSGLFICLILLGTSFHFVQKKEMVRPCLR